MINQDDVLEATKFLLERYWPLGTEDGSYYFVNGASPETITMGVILSKMSGYKIYDVMYLPYTSFTRCIHNDFDMEQIINSLDKEWLEQYKE